MLPENPRLNPAGTIAAERPLQMVGSPPSVWKGGAVQAVQGRGFGSIRFVTGDAPASAFTSSSRVRPK